MAVTWRRLAYYDEIGNAITNYSIETGKSITINSNQYLDIRLVDQYIIEGTGTLAINDNGFLSVGA